MDNFVTDSFAEKVGKAVVEGVKQMIASGQSPVEGEGRFAAYKNPLSYPGDLKPARPVNLSLTGTMLSHLGYRRNGDKIEVGILTSAPRKVKTIARVHNTGERSDIAKRQFIPEKGQDFVVSIRLKVKELFRKRVLEIIKG